MVSPTASTMLVFLLLASAGQQTLAESICAEGTEMCTQEQQSDKSVLLQSGTKILSREVQAHADEDEDAEAEVSEQAEEAEAAEEADDEAQAEEQEHNDDEAEDGEKQEEDEGEVSADVDEDNGTEDTSPANKMEAGTKWSGRRRRGGKTQWVWGIDSGLGGETQKNCDSGRRRGCSFVFWGTNSRWECSSGPAGQRRRGCDNSCACQKSGEGCRRRCGNWGGR